MVAAFRTAASSLPAFVFTTKVADIHESVPFLPVFEVLRHPSRITSSLPSLTLYGLHFCYDAEAVHKTNTLVTQWSDSAQCKR